MWRHQFGNEWKELVMVKKMFVEPDHKNGHYVVATIGPARLFGTPIIKLDDTINLIFIQAVFGGLLKPPNEVKNDHIW